MVDSPPEADPRAPVFFLSYARPDYPSPAPQQRGPDLLLQRFYADLSAHISQLFALSPGEFPGFLDRGLGGGERWDRELARAAGTCRVFVPLLTRGYFRSSWCGRELDAFQRRQVVQTQSGHHHTAVLPVLWAPLEHGRKYPRALSSIQQLNSLDSHDPAIWPQYEANGLYGLLTTRQEDAYHVVTWSLALRIAEICDECQVKPLITADVETLRNVLAEGEGA